MTACVFLLCLLPTGVIINNSKQYPKLHTNWQNVAAVTNLLR